MGWFLRAVPVLTDIVQSVMLLLLGCGLFKVVRSDRAQEKHLKGHDQELNFAADLIQHLYDSTGLKFKRPKREGAK